MTENSIDTATGRRVEIGKVCCDSVDYDRAVQLVDDYVRSGRAHLVLTPNIAQVRQASTMPAVAEAYRTASMSTPDGWPVAAALRLLGAARRQGRVTGSDLTPLLCLRDYRIGLIGGRDDSAIRAAAALQSRNPELEIGLIEPAPFDEMGDEVRRDALIARIANADLDLIFLGVGVPKQERLALDLLKQLDHGVVLCVGATIDFLAGAVPRSPNWMQRLGVEWLYRLVHEPRRLFGRYAAALPYFAWQVARSSVTSRSAAHAALQPR